VSVRDNIYVMKSTFRERLDRVLCTKLVPTGSQCTIVDQQETSDVAIKLLIESLLDSTTSENVIVIDESESLRVVASIPNQSSFKRQVSRLIGDIAIYLHSKNVNRSKVIRVGASGQSRNKWSSQNVTCVGQLATNGNTPKSEKTAYLLRSLLTRLSGTGHLIVISDFRSHMWRRTLNSLIAAGPRVTLVHLVDIADCDFVLSSDAQLDLATQPDPSPWNTPMVDSTIPPSDVHTYLTAFANLNDINLLGIIVHENSLEEIMCAFETGAIHD